MFVSLYYTDPNSGAISLNSLGVLDHERNSLYTLNVSANDSSNIAYTQVTIEITVSLYNYPHCYSWFSKQDVNDNVPTFTMPLFDAFIPEDTPRGSIVTTLIATDSDSGEFGRVIYTIDDVQPSGNFSIESTTGIVHTDDYFDREEFSGPYMISVSVYRCKVQMLHLSCTFRFLFVIMAQYPFERVQLNLYTSQMSMMKLQCLAQV